MERKGAISSKFDSTRNDDLARSEIQVEKTVGGGSEDETEELLALSHMPLHSCSNDSMRSYTSALSHESSSSIEDA